MKIKILIVPLLIVIMIWAAIWVIYPEVKLMLSKVDDLKKANDKLADIQTKNSFAEKISGELSANASLQDIILKYIPQQKRDDEIINSLNSIAAREGLSVSELSVLSPDKNAATDEKNSSKKSKLGEVKIKIGLVGEYGKIRNFLAGMSQLKRYNEINSLEIKKADSESGAEASSNVLEAEAVAAFNYISKNESLSVASSSIFSAGELDMAVLNMIKEKLTTDIAQVNVGGTGRTNPFVP